MEGKKLTNEEIQEILNIIVQIKKDYGQEIKIATLFDGDDTKILIDNRKEEELN